MAFLKANNSHFFHQQFENFVQILTLPDFSKLASNHEFWKRSISEYKLLAIYGKYFQKPLSYQLFFGFFFHPLYLNFPALK